MSVRIRACPVSKMPGAAAGEMTWTFTKRASSATTVETSEATSTTEISAS